MVDHLRDQLGLEAVLSFISFLKGYHCPSEANLPRTSWNITTYPLAAALIPKATPPSLVIGCALQQNGKLPDGIRAIDIGT
jgi:hypothetical protein